LPLIDGSIGELSSYYDHFGYCVQGVGDADEARRTALWFRRLAASIQ
jgi:hypothetical protein